MNSVWYRTGFKIGKIVLITLSITSSLRLLGSSPRTSVRQDVGRLRLSPSISSGGTREPRWVSDERRRERTAYGTVFHPSFTSPFFPRSYVTRLVTLTSFLGADWVEWEEATRIEVKRAEFQPFVDSVLLTLSPLASFACHSLRSLGGAGPEDGSERGWMACSRAERTENRSERLGEWWRS